MRITAPELALAAVASEEDRFGVEGCGFRLKVWDGGLSI